jgi:predicted ATPase/class 3 adenylate cyclase
VQGLPSGTVTFVFTDIEGSTRLWEQFPDEMRRSVARHDELLRKAIREYGGAVFSTAGDGLGAAFGRAGEAVSAAIEVQRLLAAESWPEPTAIRVRVGLHTGEADERDGDYFGPALNRAARLMAVGHGGQVVCSQVTAELLRDAVLDGVTLADLGEHRLQDLTDPVHVFQVVHPELRATFPPLRSLTALPGNLPRQLTSFVGRDREVEQVVGLVFERSVVTLTGVGGVGKTRLALQVGAELAAEFADGVWLCELAPVVDPDAVWDTLAATLEVRQSPGRALRDVLLDYLGPKRVLIVFDNCEHLLRSVALVVDAITQRCSHTVVLATSREALALAGEQVVGVPSLPVPTLDVELRELERIDAVRLFCARARDVKPEFALDHRNASAVAQLCRRLDGIPLAIELAAARVRSLSPEDLVARLDERFRLLTRGSRAALERHQTLRHTIDWSYDLLTESEQVMLNRTAVFAGGFDLPAAEAILVGDAIEQADVVDVLGQLVEKSVIDVDPTSAATRYLLLETIREYAQERLEAAGEARGVRDRYLNYYVSLAEAAGPHLRSREQLEWVAALEPDIDNLRAALSFAVETSRPEPALRMISALAVTGLSIGWTAISWAETAVTIPRGSAHQLFPEVCAYAALNATLRGDLEHGATLVERAEAAQSALRTDHTWVHTAAGTLAVFRGDLDNAQRHAKIALERARATGHPRDIADTLTALAGALSNTDPTASIEAAEDAVRVAREAGIISALPHALNLTVHGEADPTRERAVRQEIVAVALALGDHQLVATNVAIIEGLEARREDWDWPTALRTHTDAATQYLNGGNTLFATTHLQIAAVAFAKQNHLEPAAVILGFTDTHIARLGNKEFLAHLTATDTALIDALGQTRLTQLKARGAALSFSDAISYAHTEAARMVNG